MTIGNSIVFADSFLYIKNSRLDDLVGTIQSQEGNRVEILDEQDKRLKRFVLLRNNPGVFSVGLRVRIYYRSFDNVIETILPMTPVEYKKEGQNLGYILKSE